MKTIKIFLAGTALLFVVIGSIGWMKKKKGAEEKRDALVQELVLPRLSVEVSAVEEEAPISPSDVFQTRDEAELLPEADRIEELFALGISRLPFVETVAYTSRVPWLKGRPAWIADYATHYATSRHFIARSLNRKPDYFTQKINPGDRFNVFKKEAQIAFHLTVDLSRAKMWFYCIDLEQNERYLLKTYSVGLGRLSAKKASGSLTPVGKYMLGEKIAIYKPGTLGFFQDQKREMIQVFGTRWIPFEKELEGCSEPARGFGLHGAPWKFNDKGELVEELDAVGKYTSDGCIRLKAEDIEELFSIVITKPTTIELVKDFHEAHPPGKLVPFEPPTPLSPKL